MMMEFPLLWLGILALLLCAFGLCYFIRGWRFGIGFSAVAFLLYFAWGGASDFTHVSAYRIISNELELLTQNPDLSIEMVLNRLDHLKSKVTASHKGLARLASIYAELGYFSQSVELLEQAMAKSPKSSEYVLQWVYHQSFLHQGKLPDPVRERLNRLLEDPSTKLAALNMIAMDNYFKEDYDSAILHWTDVLQNDPELTLERREVIEKAIANAREKMVGLSVSGG